MSTNLLGGGVIPYDGYSDDFISGGRPQEGFDVFGRFAPWGSGVLWTSSRCFGAVSSMGILGADAETTARWGNVKDTGGQEQHKLIGTTRSSDGTPLGTVVVDAFTTADDVKRGSVVSDAGGYFECCTPEAGSHYLVGYKAGSPDVSGASRNTLTPA